LVKCGFASIPPPRKRLTGSKARRTTGLRRSLRQCAGSAYNIIADVTPRVIRKMPTRKNTTAIT